MFEVSEKPCMNVSKRNTHFVCLLPGYLLNKYSIGVLTKMN